MRIVPVPDPWRQSVRVVADAGNNDIDPYLAADEREVFESFRFESRRIEWGASRVAAKLLALDLQLCRSALECRIPTHSERPRLELPRSHQELFVSISHSKGAGAAALDKTPIGIDLQEIQEIHPRTRKYFLNDDEWRLADDLDIEAPLIHLWAAKEAVWKVEPGEGWYRSGRVAITGATGSGLTLDWERHGNRGGVETHRIDDRFVLALAR